MKDIYIFILVLPTKAFPFTKHVFEFLFFEKMVIELLLNNKIQISFFWNNSHFTHTHTHTHTHIHNFCKLLKEIYE
jgi:hypothetical protein